MNPRKKTPPLKWTDQPWTWITGARRRRRLVKSLAQWFVTRVIHHEMMGPEGARLVLWGCPEWGTHLARVFLGESSAVGPRRMFHPRWGIKRMRARVLHDGLLVGRLDVVGSDVREQMLQVPEFIEMEMPTPPDMKAYRESLPCSARSDLRLLDRSGLEVRRTEDPAMIGPFHRSIYQPCITARFGMEAKFIARLEMEKMMRRGGHELFQIYKDGECIAGCLAEVSDQDYRVLVLAKRPGQPERGAGVATYWACIRRANELMTRRILWGGCRPYLDDGVMAYKAKWGAVLTSRHYRHRAAGWWLEPGHPRVVRLLKQHCLIILVGDRRPAVLSARQPHECQFPRSLLGSLAGWYRVLGECRSGGVQDLSELPEAWRRWCVRESLANCRGTESGA